MVRKDIVRNKGCFLVALILSVLAQKEKKMTLGERGMIPGN